MREKLQLTHPQQRILFTHLMFQDAAVCNIGGYAIFEGSIDFQKLQYALKATTRIMDCMRLRICRCEKEYYQYVDSRDIEIETCFFDGEDLDSQLLLKVKNIVCTPFSLEDSPLCRLVAFKNGNGLAGYIICCHHIIMDGWSIKLFTESVSACYGNVRLMRGSYLRFINDEKDYLSSLKAQKDRAYWDDILDKYYNPVPCSCGESRECGGWREEFSLDDYMPRFNRLSRRYNSANAILVSCFQLLEHLRGGTGILSLPNYNRIGHAMRRTGGMFTSTQLFAVDIDDSRTLSSFQELVTRQLFASYRHQSYPYDMLGISSQTTPFLFSVNYYNMNLSQRLGTAAGAYHEVYPGVQAIPFQVVLKEWGRNATMFFDMRCDKFHNGDGIAFYNFFLTWMEFLENTPEMKLCEFKRKVAGRNRRLQESTYRVREYRREDLASILRRFATKPNIPNSHIICGQYELDIDTFLGLIAGAIDVFRKYSLHQGDKVIFWMKNSLEYVVFAHAALFCGICFIPLDYGYSPTLVKTIYDDANAKLLFSDKSVAGVVSVAPILNVGASHLPEDVEEKELAYMIYTSGTTGRPKGVMISRAALGNYISWAKRVYGKETFFLHSSPSFDMGITTLFLPTLTDGRLVIDASGRINLYKLPSSNLADAVTAIKATPSELSLILEKDTSRLRLNVIVCGGEELSSVLAARLQTRFGNTCKIFNEYGPTECTVGCMCYRYTCDNSCKESVSIGKAAPGCTVYVLDHMGQLCPIGLAGEICIAGAQLAVGYWKLEDENKEKFVFHKSLNRRIYKTGDMGRYLPNGTVEYLGRYGRQRKINGFRIELDSVERVLRSVVGVRNAVVWENNKKIVAAVESDLEDVSQINETCRLRLPSYCIPHQMFRVRQIPCARNGKVDYNILNRQLDQEIGRKRESLLSSCKDDQQKYRIVLEKAIREIMNFNGVIEDFNYLRQGGDSITALRLISTLEEYGFKLTLADILDYPDFLQMASRLTPITGGELPRKDSDFEIPSYISYLLDTCDSFGEYCHVMVIKVPRIQSLSELQDLVKRLFSVFPILSTEYKDGRLCATGKDSTWCEFEESMELDHNVNEWIKRKVSDCPECLFHLHCISRQEYSLLKFCVHHVLVDGSSWYAILKTTKSILAGKDLIGCFNAQYYPRETISYSWCPVKYTRASYRMMSGEVDVNAMLPVGRCYEIVQQTLSSVPRLKHHTLMCEWNRRTVSHNNEPEGVPEGIGCYSLLVPVTIDGDPAESQIRKALAGKNIVLKANRALRVNYVGNIEDMLLSLDLGTSVKYLRQCVEANLLNCSAFGCDAEFTILFSENRLGVKCVIYVSSRSSAIDDELMRVVLNKLKDEFSNSYAGCLFPNVDANQADQCLSQFY